MMDQGRMGEDETRNVLDRGEVGQDGTKWEMCAPDQ